MVSFINPLAVTVLLLSFFRDYATAADTISLSDSLSDGRTLISSNGSFELGFFSPGSSKRRYVGIWYKNKVQKVVWVANRCNPINDTSGNLTFNNRGNLVVLSGIGSVAWSSNATRVAQSPIAQLLDSGNLVIRNQDDTDSNNYLWQSFDYPTDTVVSGMKIGWNLKTGFNRCLSAWRSSDDPCPGDVTWGIELNNLPQPALWKGPKKLFRGSPYAGLVIKELVSPNRTQLYNSSFVVTEDEVHLIFYLKSKSFLAIAVVNQTAESYQGYASSETTERWRLSFYLPKDYCETFRLCGPFGSCTGGLPQCQCLRGFTPKSQVNWDSADWSEGCVRKNPLNCQNGDGFGKVLGLELPDTTHTWVNRSMSLPECRAKCLANCSCTAYTNFDMSGAGSGCSIWFHDLIDLRRTLDDKKLLFVRMSAADLSEDRKHKAAVKIVIIVTVITVLFMLLAAASYYLYKRRKTSRDKKVDLNSEKDINQETEDLELPLFGFPAISEATNNFSEQNKLGKGGFGTVYKGTLVDGQDIAVKRLSKSSGQGINEFKNEVILIAKLQHRNLVKLLGCCIQEDEKMLIYEYMPNKSLDFFIFDEKRSKQLDWSRRYHIICGIARGLIYLHQDSRLRIIHRDLKASNVLLDSDMNPKISDFGMARTFGGDQTEGNTNRVVGTYGYMAPEYATDGLFSVKSDVFSFGILLLEIISGKRSRGFYHLSDNNLIGYAWRLWKEGKQTELVDETIAESCDLAEVNRCIHIGLLCVQQHPEDRPNMASVVLMLSRESSLPQPNEPGFFKERGLLNETSSSSKQGYTSMNEVTISLLDAR